MQTAATKQNLAHEIGLCRIAMVVTRFYSLVEVDPNLATSLCKVNDWQEHRARMTYFWWEALGGYTRNRGNFEIIRREAIARYSPDLMDAWMTLFRSVVFSSIEPRLADGWMKEATRIGRTVQVSAEARERRLSGAEILNFAS